MNNAARGWAPGRCTIVGEHVDYAGGLALCMAIDLGVSVAVRHSDTGMFSVTSGNVRITRPDPAPAGDLADRVLAPIVVLRARGIAVPSVAVDVTATLPSGAGLASSAAVIVASAIALLRLMGRRCSAADLVGIALSAERDVVGVPCGVMDQHAVVEAPEQGLLVIDCAHDTVSCIEWPWPDVLLCACDTGEHHDVGGAAYRQRRDETLRGLAALGVGGCQDIDLGAMGTVRARVSRRLRHAVEETRRVTEAAAALRTGDLQGLGGLMSASHRSLRDLHEVSTPALDAVVAAAESVSGCAGARMVGAGFGGAAVALVREHAARPCAAAMSAASGGGATWMLRPSPGAAALAPDVIGG